MSIKALLAHRYEKVPTIVIDKILANARTKAKEDFDVYAIASPVVIRVSAAYELLELCARLGELPYCSACEIKSEIHQIIHEGIDTMVAKILA